MRPSKNRISENLHKIYQIFLGLGLELNYRKESIAISSREYCEIVQIRMIIPSLMQLYDPVLTREKLFTDYFTITSKTTTRF